MRINCFALARYAELHDGLLSAQGFGLNRFYWPQYPALTPPLFVVLGVEEDPELEAPQRRQLRFRQVDADGRTLAVHTGELEVSPEKPSLSIIPMQIGAPVPGDYVLLAETSPLEEPEQWEQCAAKRFRAELPCARKGSP